MRLLKVSVAALVLLGGCARRPDALEVALSIATHDERLKRVLSPTSAGRKSELTIEMPERADGLTTVRRGPMFLRLRAIGASNVRATAVAGRVVIAQATNDADYVLAPSCELDSAEACKPNGVEWAILLRRAEGRAAFEWAIELSADLPKRRVEADGAISFLTADDSAVFRIARPYALDSDGKRRDADLSLDGSRLSIGLETEGLHFPVLVDPAIETPVWQDFLRTPPPIWATSVFDTLRNEVVAFGGSPAFYERSDGTWTWNGTSWSRLQLTVSPPARSKHAMTWDSTRQRGVLFGGEGSQLLADTWEWNGSAWLRLSPTISPDAREHTAMAYDSVRGETVLFGGRLTSDASDDTWLWNGSNWRAVNPVVRPPRRYGHQMAFDPIRQRVVLRGGWAPDPVLGGLTISRETWEWDGANWSNVTTAPSPSAGTGGLLVFDSSRGEIQFIGGTDRMGNPTSETWSWNGIAWQLLQVSGAVPRQNHSGAYDSVRNRVVVIGGREIEETFELVLPGWTQVPVRPPVRQFHASAYDPVNAQTLVFGGQTLPRSQQVPINDTWLWNGSGWRELHPTVAPSPRVFAATATDFVRRRVVLFGGITLSGIVDETWEWDGTTWMQRSPVHHPGALRSAATWDPLRQRVVLFQDSTTWEWDGTDWSERLSAHVPRAQDSRAMAWDPTRSEIVMFSGGNGAPDTHTWNGSDWTAQPYDLNGPRPNTLFSMASTLRGPVMNGGENENRTWERLDGGWVARTSPDLPMIRGGTMVEDPVRRRVVKYGGSTAVPGVLLTDVWEFRVRGGSCITGNDCDTGWCVDGACCDTSCGGGNVFDCQACSRALGGAEDGVCGEVICRTTDSCLKSACEPSSGRCAPPVPKADGEACDDRSQCTTNDVCLAGVCSGASAANGSPCSNQASTCFFGHWCQSGVCAPLPSTRLPAGTPCSDGNTCTVQDTCDDAGACNGLAVSDGTSCISDAGCTIGDSCHAGTCIAGRSQCPLVDCASGTCITAQGRCEYAAEPDGVACDDQDPCTVGAAVCVNGRCDGGLACAIQTECREVPVCSSTNVSCLSTPLADFTLCDGGLCVAGDCVVNADDAGVAVDAGADAGTEFDAGIVDGGMADAAAIDVGNAPEDGGVGTPQQGGCSCTSSALDMALMLLLLAFKRRRPEL